MHHSNFDALLHLERRAARPRAKMKIQELALEDEQSLLNDLIGLAYIGGTICLIILFVVFLVLFFGQK